MHIAIDGVIASGKTTLARLFAQHANATAAMEDFEGNKFLADFYQDRSRWSLPMQLWFLTERHAQLTSAEFVNAPLVVTDHTFAKDLVFAHMLLDARSLELY